MKNLLIALIICTAFYSCKQDNRESIESYYLKGKHELRKFNVKTSERTISSGYWLLIGGSYNSESKEESKIRFYFKTINSEYVFKELDFTKVYIKIDSSAITPYVKFFWINGGIDEHSVYDESISRCVIYCKEKDFTPEVNINQLQ